MKSGETCPIFKNAPARLPCFDSPMKTDKELYRKLRTLSCEALWRDEVPRFDQSPPEVRIKRVAIIRAVGSVFSRFGNAKQRSEARSWLIHLLKDPSEKVRRYAITALPKLGSGPTEEQALLSLLQATTIEREKKFIGQALEKIGGATTLNVVSGVRGSLLQTEQKVKASLARRQNPSVIRMDRPLFELSGLRIHLHCRKGLEEILHDEVKEYIAKHRKFRVIEVRRGLVALKPVAPFSLENIYTLRCFATAGFFLGRVQTSNPAASVDALASLIASPLSQTILKTFTEGSIRYRLEFVSRGHQRGTVRLLSQRAYAICPDILNDPQRAPWSMDMIPEAHGLSIELRPKLTPDPRFTYRAEDFRAASHPPLAASMARLGRGGNQEIVWDPFCGSGLELIERARLGGVRHLYGTDLNPDAMEMCRTNFTAANLKGLPLTLACCDFRDYAKAEGLGPGSLTLILTNPPMGRRIRIPDIRGLFKDLFDVASIVLKPGGRLIFANPLRIEPSDSSLILEYRRTVDLGGFNCRLEGYRKLASDGDPHRAISQD